MKINIVMNSFIRQPSGGAKVIYTYANHFARRGHQVTMIFCVKNPVSKFRGKAPYPVRLAAQWGVVHIGPPWFSLDKRIRLKYTTKIDKRSVPDADIIFATAVGTAKPVAALPDRKGKDRYYLIQGFENWSLPDEEVYRTYQLGMVNIPISKWLAELVCEHSKNCVFIPNGIDVEKFRIILPPKKRMRHSVAMVYQTGEYKGFIYGYQAVLKLKQVYPDLQCHLFGASKRPDDWPDWIQYTQNASEDQLVEIYNRAAVFLCSSVAEGYGLCGAESMACGCAYASSDYAGLYTYAAPGENVLVCRTCDTDGLVKNVSDYFENDELRIRFAYAGNRAIQKHSWREAFQKMDALIGSQ